MPYVETPEEIDKRIDLILNSALAALREVLALKRIGKEHEQTMSLDEELEFFKGIFTSLIMTYMLKGLKAQRKESMDSILKKLELQF